MLKLSPKKNLQGIINVPGDKSISHRAVLFASIADGVSRITNFLNGHDCVSTINCFRDLGVNIDTDKENVIINGCGMHGLKPPRKTLFTGNSGTTTRLLTGLLSAQPFNSVVDGDDSIRTRPMKRIITPLSMMGANISAAKGEHCPLIINGKKLHGIDYTLPVPSAQLKSALILAGLYAEGETIIRETISSRNHTELMLGMFGADSHVDGLNIHIKSVPRLFSCDINVPGDISSAAFFMVAGLISENSEIVIKNVGINETRSGIIKVLKDMGGAISIENITGDYEQVADITVKSSNLKGVTVAGDIIPSLIDEIPVIAVAAAFAEGRTVISDAAELKHKETNRIDTIVSELKKANVDIHGTEDGLIIDGGNTVKGNTFNSHGDHRLAMAMSVLALAAERDSVIQGEEAASVSYPDFYMDLAGLTR